MRCGRGGCALGCATRIDFSLDPVASTGRDSTLFLSGKRVFVSVVEVVRGWTRWVNILGRG